MMLTAAAVAVLAAMAMALARVLMGPTVYDKILAVNSFVTKTVLLIALLGAMAGRADYLDVAMLYALISFIGTVALMKYAEFEAVDDKDSTDFDGQEG